MIKNVTTINSENRIWNLKYFNSYRFDKGNIQLSQYPYNDNEIIYLKKKKTPFFELPFKFQ
ncbi:hypothetical protein ASF99_13745 [Exiguobacterium sp. Leaf187]|nr:hypothetical protein ASF99_13745 [Exiguobacterium sp. Leaf187]